MALLNDKRRLGSLLLLCFSGFYLLHASQIPVDPVFADDAFNARTLPVGLALLALLCGLAQLVLPPHPDADDRIGASFATLNWKPLLLLSVLMLAYAVSFTTLGFLLGGGLLLFFGFVILGERRWGLSIVVAASIVGALWAVLTLAFGLQLEAGDLHRWLVA